MTRPTLFLILIGVLVAAPSERLARASEDDPLTSIRAEFDFPSGDCPFPCADSATLVGDDVIVSYHEGGFIKLAVYAMTESTGWERVQTIDTPEPCAGLDGDDCVSSFGYELAGNQRRLFAEGMSSFSSERQGVLLVYSKNNDLWQHEQSIELGAGIIDIAVRGSLLAVLTGGSQRTVHLLRRTPWGSYESEAELEVESASSIALGPGVLVVGMASENDSTGAAYVFARRPHLGWVLEQRLEPSLPGRQQFGGSVAASGRSIAIGALQYYSDDPRAYGVVYLYTRGRWGYWHETQKMFDPYTPPPEKPEQFPRQYGFQLAMRGPWLMIGGNAGWPPYDSSPVTFLAHRKFGRWQLVAEFASSTTNMKVQFNRSKALVVQGEQSFGNTVRVFDLPRWRDLVSQADAN